MADAKDQEISSKVSYKDTLNLPRTDFPIRAQAAIDDPQILARWQNEDLYKKSFIAHQGAQKYIVHDGPPYANGNIHLGHAYNKVLKDIAAKAHRMMGRHVPVTPGWDCHGLPIELKVTTEQPGLAPAALKQACRKYAQQWIDAQREQFKQLGILMDWENPYLTMAPDYEAATVRAFAKFVKLGYIGRKNKTVPWCASCQTVLATAEIEYAERKDPSLYVAFPLTPETQQRAFKDIKESISVLIWTTTPWTLPLNKMVLLKPGGTYDVIVVNAKLYVVGAALSEAVCKKLGVEKHIVASCKAEDLIGGFAQHPFIDGQTSAILPAHFVGLEDGTACVHGAPGCGPDDYEIGVKNGIEIFSPLTPSGCYAQGIKPEELEGQDVTKVHGWVITTLTERGHLVHKESIKHSYPHCWRCRNGLIFRATKQWFCDLAHNDLRERALAAIETTQFIPARTQNRLKASVGGRLEWCLSRQRTWGVPIVAALCIACDTALVDPEMINTVADAIAQEGIEYWDRAELSDVLPKNAQCAQCGGSEFKKEHDILDVWFDSGVSHAAVLRNNPMLSFPADLYIEGSDQHRGWFQSSLLTSVALEGVMSTRAIATHGYTVDVKGHKMSKSLGNVVAPQEMIDQLGTDGLRLWASSIDAESDAVVSKVLLENIKEVFRKIRNTCRFLVSNLYDFDKEKDMLVVEKLSPIDQYALYKLEQFSNAVQKSYGQYDVTAVQHLFADYCASELSAFYLDIIKDRLYTDVAEGNARRSAQTVCWHMVDVLTKLMAPVLSFTAEQLADCYQEKGHPSIHLQTFSQVPVVWAHNEVAKKECQWEALRSVRPVVLKALETLREKAVIKHSLEAKVTLTMNPSQENLKPVTQLLADIHEAGHNVEDFLKEYFIVSACDISAFEAEEAEELEETENEQCQDCECECEQEIDTVVEDRGLLVKASHANGSKCPRCWQWEATDHEHGLCKRCQFAVSQKQSS